MSADDGATVALRYMYRGETLRNGRLLMVQTEVAPQRVSGAQLLEALRAPEANVPLSRLVPFYYAKELEGWRPLRMDSSIPVGVERRVEVMLEPPANPRAPRGGDVADEGRQLGARAAATVCDATALDPAEMGARCASDGFFGIGVYNAKSVENVGTLWRSAYQLGAAFLFTVGTRYRQQPTDTLRTDSRLPLFELDDWSAFVNFAPARAKWVAIEMGGTPLAEFEHPHNAVYILGSEDAGLPPSILSACHEVVSIPSERYSSYNVASAGSIVLYDRLAKKERRKERE